MKRFLTWLFSDASKQAQEVEPTGVLVMLSTGPRYLSISDLERLDAIADNAAFHRDALMRNAKIAQRIFGVSDSDDQYELDVVADIALNGECRRLAVHRLNEHNGVNCRRQQHRCKTPDNDSGGVGSPRCKVQD